MGSRAKRRGRNFILKILGLTQVLLYVRAKLSEILPESECKILTGILNKALHASITICDTIIHGHYNTIGDCLILMFSGCQ